MRKALILVDYINEICHPQGKISGCAKMVEEQGIVKKVNVLVDYARTNGWFIVWIIVGFDKNYYEVNTKSPIFKRAKEFNALVRGEWGTELLADLNYQDGELIICKNAVNPFYATSLDHVLHHNNVDEIYVAGVSTEVAIQSCVRDAHNRGYIVNLDFRRFLRII